MVHSVGRWECGEKSSFVDGLVLPTLQGSCADGIVGSMDESRHGFPLNEFNISVIKKLLWPALCQYLKKLCTSNCIFVLDKMIVPVVFSESDPVVLLVSLCVYILNSCAYK